MKQILVATDFSNSAANAMDYAMALAKTLNLEVYAIHAVTSIEGVNNNIYNALYIEDYHNKKREALKEWADGYASREEYAGVPVHTLVEVGSVKSVISKYVDKNHVELLVMGIIGSTGLSGLVGSNASSVVETVKIPTLIVPLESKFLPAPILTLATDYETRLSADDVNALNEMVAAFGSNEMKVLYVQEGSAPKSIEADESKLRDLIKSTRVEFNTITSSNPIAGILDFVDKNTTDILCLVKRHHNIIYRMFTRSTVSQVINRSVKAVLILHE